MRNKNKLSKLYLLIILNIIQIIFSSTCMNENEPFLRNGTCISYCSKEEIELNTCIIDNEKVKIQYISNWIIIGEEGYRYINIDSDEYNNIVVQTSKSEESGDRIFYGLQNNGRYLFKDDNQNEYPYLIITQDKVGDAKRFEGESLFIKLCDRNGPSSDINNYFLSIAKGGQNAELFDFKNKDCSKKASEIFIDENIYSDRGTFQRIINKENKEYTYLYLFSAVIKEGNNYKLFLKTFYFTDNNLDSSEEGEEEEEEEEEEEINCIESKMISCFETLAGKIICFYRKSNSNKNFYYIFVSQCCFKNNQNYKFKDAGSSDLFYKAIHLKEEIGVFSYFQEELNDNPKLSFLIFDKDNNYQFYKTFGTVELNFKDQFNGNYMLNDILKISATKICYISPNEEKKELYVVIITLSANGESMDIKYYNQLIYAQNHYMIYQDLRLALFNNKFIALGASVCPYDSNDHYASFLIFSYPNSTDDTIDLIKLLNETNEEIASIGFNLEKNTKIENNLFEYYFYRIQIINYSGNITLKSTKTNSTIDRNSKYIMTKGENFTIEYESNDIYYTGKYIIEFALVISDSNYSENDIDLLLKKDSPGNPNVLQKEILLNNYIGKASYYSIIIEKDLTTIKCDNFCSLCLKEQKDICITCKFPKNLDGECKESEIISSTTSLFNSIMSTKVKLSSTLIITSTEKYYSSYIKEYLPVSTIIEKNVLSSYISLKSTSTSIKSSIIKDFSSIPNSFILNPSTSSIISPFSSKTIDSKIDLTKTTIITSDLILPNKNECTKEKILENECQEGNLEDKQIEDFHNILKERLKDFNNTNTIIETKNVIFQISTLDQQRNNYLLNISSIELGDCETKIIKIKISDFQNI